MGAPGSELTLKTAKQIRVPVLPSDEQIIKDKAKLLRLSTADYLRKLGLGYEPRGTVDMHAVTELAKVNGDQGRLGGLLKLWLTDDEKVSAAGDDPQGLRIEISELLKQILACQVELQSVMRRIVEGER